MDIKINNISLKKTFGVDIQQGGLNDFFLMPTRKESLTNNSLDRDGQEVDLVNPRFEARKFNLGVIQRGFGDTIENAIVDFWNKYDALFTELSKPGLITLEIEHLNKEFKVYYSELTGFDKYTKLIVQNDFVWVKYEIVFHETNPNINITKVFLVDDQDRFLIQ